jgi:hypothetical protein
VSYRLRPEPDDAPDAEAETPWPAGSCPVAQLWVALQRGEPPPQAWRARWGAGGRDPALGAWLACDSPGAMRELLLCAMRAKVEGAAELFWRGADAGWGRDAPPGEQAHAVRRAVPAPPPYEALIGPLAEPRAHRDTRYPGGRRFGKNPLDDEG